VSRSLANLSVQTSSISSSGEYLTVCTDPLRVRLRVFGQHGCGLCDPLDDAALPVVLSLLDQLYALRRELATLRCTPPPP
jgi:hypothetical protein